jgi:hypothetical protein
MTNPVGGAGQPGVAAPRKGQKLVAFTIAIATAGSTVLGIYNGDKRLAVLGFVGMVFATILTLAIQNAIHAFGRPNQRFYDILVKVLVAFVVLYFMAFCVALFSQLIGAFRTRSDVSGTWKVRNGNFELICKTKSSDVRCSADSGGFKHFLDGKYVSDDMIRGSIARIQKSTSCEINAPFTIVMRSDERFDLTWKAPETKFCDLSAGYPVIENDYLRESTSGDVEVRHTPTAGGADRNETRAAR